MLPRVALLCGAVAAARADFTVLRATCAATVELLPDSPVGVTADLSRWRKAADAAYGRVRERLRCHCPELTDAQFADRFDPFRVVLNLVSGKAEHEEHIPCLDSQEKYTRDLHKWLSGTMLGSELTLPPSCTRAAYVSEQGCRATLDLEKELGAKLNVAVSACPGTPLPAVGVWCSGPACATLFRPCDEGQCAAGQQCLDASSAFADVMGEPMKPVRDLLDMFFGVNATSVWDHLAMASDGDFSSDRSLADCASDFAAVAQRLVSGAASALLGRPATGVCVPEGWGGVSAAAQSYLGRWEELSGPPRKDECAPLVKRTDSQFTWRRGQVTDYGLSGGGWCTSYEDCNFHKNAGDCESNDDFEYFMSKLYCRYKQRDRCGEYGPYCVWDPKVKDKYKCKFNESTQNDGIREKEDWLKGINCDNIEVLGPRCKAYHDSLPRCEQEYCACSGGTWDREEELCTPPTERSGSCKDMVPCWSQLEQCYQKTEKSPYMATPQSCEEYFMCRCVGVATEAGCDPKAFCSRRCACLHNERDRFVGPYCDIRLNRGSAPVIFTSNPDEADPVAEWDGVLPDGRGAAQVLREAQVPAELAPPQPRPGSEAQAIAVFECDGRLWLLPGSPVAVAVHFRGLDQLAAAAAAAAAPAARCALSVAGNKPPAEEDWNALETAWMPHMPAMWLARFADGSEDAILRGSLADWLFNATGGRQPDEPSLQQLVNDAQRHQAFYHPMPEDPGPGWHNYIATHLSNAVKTTWASLILSLRGLGWVEHDLWYHALMATQNIQSEEERKSKMREVLQNRQDQVVAAQLEQVGPRWRGRVGAPDGVSAATWQKTGRTGGRLPLPDGAGTLELHAARCPGAAGRALAAVQVGATGELADAVNFARTCNGLESEVCPVGRCATLRTTFFEAPLFGHDFTAGFLWGGNFTKGFIGGCPILSATINTVAHDSTASDCVGEDLWARDVHATLRGLVHNASDDCSGGQDCILWRCVPSLRSVGHALAASAEDTGNGVMRVPGTAPVDAPPFAAPPYSPAAPPAAAKQTAAAELRELQRRKEAAVEAEDFDEAKRLKGLITELKRSRADEL